MNVSQWTQIPLILILGGQEEAPDALQGIALTVHSTWIWTVKGGELLSSSS